MQGEYRRLLASIARVNAKLAQLRKACRNPSDPDTIAREIGLVDAKIRKQSRLYQLRRAMRERGLI